MKNVTYGQAILEAQEFCLSKYQNVFLMGLGVPDPKGVFGTSKGLQEKFGVDRVFDIPLSENAATGVALGAAITESRPILAHQRVDFALVSMEQIINQAAKWYFMFNSKTSVPIVIRMLIGRGWGQGPQHSQSLQSLFAHIPGLKVIMPTFPRDARDMLIAAVEDDNPVICFEHRWLYNLRDNIPESAEKTSISKARVVSSGEDITMVTCSYQTIECLKAARELYDRCGVKAEIIDLRSIRPLDVHTIIKSVQKTGRVLIVDNAHSFAGMSAEILSVIIENGHSYLKKMPCRMGFKEYATPTSRALAHGYYPGVESIFFKALDLLEIRPDGKIQKHFSGDGQSFHPDQPDSQFNGPF